MPQMGYDMTEGTVVRWVKKVGDKVHRGDIVAEIETDKATVEIEAFEGGTLLRIMVEPGQTVPVGAPIATLGEAGEALPEAAPRAPAPPPTPPAAPPAAAAPDKAPAPEPPLAAGRPAAPAAALPALTGEVHASPLARRLAAQLGVDLARVRGSGPGGRIVAADVEAASGTGPAPAEPPTAAPAAASGEPPAAAAARASAPAPPGAEDHDLSRLRQAIGRRMAESKQTAPHFYVSVDINADALLDLRQQLKAAGDDVSVNDMLVKALAIAATEHPGVNAAFIDGRIRTFEAVDVGIAVATENGLLSPAIADCGAKTVQEIAAAGRDLVTRARAGRLKPEEYGGGTITLSNLGMFGVDQFLAILNPPQAVIVAVGAAAERVVAVNGKPAVTRVMTAWAAADHRVLDGADVGRFTATLREVIEDPSRIAPAPAGTRRTPRSRAARK